MQVNTPVKPFHIAQPTVEEQKQWDQLVANSGASVFSESRYLNALLGEWVILYNEDRSGGMVCPFVIKLGRKILINPIYHQFSEWVGKGELTDEGITFLKSEFSVSQLFFRNDGFFENCHIIKRKHQIIESNEFLMNSLSKRMLKKSLVYEIRSNDEISLIYKQVDNDLIGRVQGMNKENVKHLKKLVESFKGNGLHSFCVYKNDAFAGGIWVLENANSWMYLKGSVTEIAKKEGAMYLLLSSAINQALSKNKTFDFGGSNAESVRRFNLNLGGKDVDYVQLLWNSAPWWWNLLRSLKQKIK